MSSPKTEGSGLIVTGAMQFPAADALRLLAIATVVAFHFAYRIVDSAMPGAGARLDFLGVWGVACFFVLSGYLLGRPFVNGYLRPATPFPNVATYFERRLLRIYPLYAVAVLVSALVATHHYRSVPIDVAVHLLFLHGFSATFIASLNSPLWTMAVDAQFYVALPLVAGAAIASTRGVANARTRVTILCALLIAIALSSVAWRFGITTVYPAALFAFGPHLALVRNLAGVGGCFATGVLLAAVDLLAKGRDLRRPAIAAGIAALALFVWTARYPMLPSPFAVNALNDFIAAVSAGGLLFFLANSHIGLIERVLRARLTSGLAKLSYATYLFHQVVAGFVLKFVLARLHVSSITTTAGAAIFVIASAGLLFAVAYVAHRFVELPFLRLKDSRALASTVIPSKRTLASPNIA